MKCNFTSKLKEKNNCQFTFTDYCLTISIFLTVSVTQLLSRLYLRSSAFTGGIQLAVKCPCVISYSWFYLRVVLKPLNWIVHPPNSQVVIFVPQCSLVELNSYSTPYVVCRALGMHRGYACLNTK